MQGFIKRREIILNTRTVVRLYGVKVYFLCLTSKKGETFLGILVKCGKL